MATVFGYARPNHNNEASRKVMADSIRQTTHPVANAAVIKTPNERLAAGLSGATVGALGGLIGLGGAMEVHRYCKRLSQHQ